MTPELRKRRHPDGFVLWDVFVDGRRVGLVRQHAVKAPSWFAYTLTSDEPVGRFPFRRDAVAALAPGDESGRPGGSDV